MSPHNPEKGLYLVSTPVGNMRDITLRALDVLSSAHSILCEDKRVTGKLLHHYGIKKPLLKYNDHSDQKDRDKIIQGIREGDSYALVSDAGTPLISDPGFKLVRACFENGLKVIPVPGANAVLPSLQLSGFATDSFTFLGFLPRKRGEREKILTEFTNNPCPLVIYESARRLSGTLTEASAILGNRDAVIIREITKLYEERISGLLHDLAERFSSQAVKGEIVVVIAPQKQEAWTETTVKAALASALESGLSGKDAARDLAKQSGWPKTKVYNLALSLKDERTDKL